MQKTKIAPHHHFDPMTEGYWIPSKDGKISKFFLARPRPDVVTPDMVVLGADRFKSGAATDGYD